MRAYFFGNMYLSSIQQGIQSAHVLSDMFMKYVTISEDYEIDSDPKRIMLWTWAKEHKTMILLNGGYSENIRELCEFFFSDDNVYPWSFFNEGEDALDGALTCAGIILPEKIYEAAALTRIAGNGCKEELIATNALYIDDTRYEYSNWDIELLARLNKFRLAN